jgi:hypothetical protein
MTMPIHVTVALFGVCLMIATIAWDALRRYIDHAHARDLAHNRDQDRERQMSVIATRLSMLEQENGLRKHETADLGEQLEAAHKRNVEQFGADDKALSELVKRLSKVERAIEVNASVILEVKEAQGTLSLQRAGRPRSMMP